MAREAHVAGQAVLREALALVEPELALARGRDQIDHVVLGDVAQQVVGFDEVIA